MAVKASAEAIREMKKHINDTIKDLEKVSEGIRTGIRSTQDWEDSKAAEFNMLMQKVARLTATPIDTLRSATPKLERLAQAVDRYTAQHIGK